MTPLNRAPVTPLAPEPAAPSLDALVERCLPAVQQWAHGKVPRAARGQIDTRDLTQEAALRMLQRNSRFIPRHGEAVQAYMRLTVMNLIRDEARRLARRPESVELSEEPACGRTGPLQFSIRQELRAHYEQALRQLRPNDRRLVAARLEEGRSTGDIRQAFALPSPAAARMAVNRALNRLMKTLHG